RRRTVRLHDGSLLPRPGFSIGADGGDYPDYRAGVPVSGHSMSHGAGYRRVRVPYAGRRSSAVTYERDKIRRSDAPTRLTDRRFDPADPLVHAPRLDRDQVEAEAAVGLFVDLLETKRLLEGDSARAGGRDEAEIADEEDAGFVDRFLSNALQLRREKGCTRIAEVDGQGGGADGAT